MRGSQTTDGRRADQDPQKLTGFKILDRLMLIFSSSEGYYFILLKGVPGPMPLPPKYAPETDPKTKHLEPCSSVSTTVLFICKVR